MTNEIILENEKLELEQLDRVAGGNGAMTEDDSIFLYQNAP